MSAPAAAPRLLYPLHPEQAQGSVPLWLLGVPSWFWERGPGGAMSRRVRVHLGTGSQWLPLPVCTRALGVRGCEGHRGVCLLGM